MHGILFLRCHARLKSRPRAAVTLSSAEASLYCGEAGEKEKESARGTMGRGKREERPLPYNVRFSGQICGSLTMAEAGEDLADFECSFKDLSLEG